MSTGYAGIKKSYLPFVLFSVLGLAACETPEEMAEDHLQKGKELYEKGEYNKAILELKTSSQSGDQRSETYYYMALLDEKSQRFKSMRDNLLKTVELDPDNLEARQKLAQVFLLFGDLDKALEQVDYLLGVDPSNEAVQILKASTYIRQGKKEETINIIDSVLEKNPENIDALSLKVAYLYEVEQFDQALSVSNAVLEKNAKNLPVRLLRIKINAKKNNADAVIDEYKYLVELYPDVENFKLTLASIYTLNDKLQPAEALLREMAEKAPNKLEPKIILLEFLNKKGKDRVVDEFNAMLASSSNNSSLMLELCKWLLGAGYLDPAVVGLQKVAELHGDNKVGLSAQTILAEIALKRKEYDRVETLLADVLKADSGFIDANLLKARLFLTQNKVDEAVELLNRLVWSKKDSDNAFMLLGQAYVLKKDMKQADRYFKEALEINPANIQAFMPIYGSYLKANQKEVARQLLGKALSRKPNDTLLLTKKAELDISEKKWDDAQETVQRLALLSANKDVPLYLQGNILQGKAEYDQAISVYKKLLAEHPNHLNSMVNLVRSYGALEQRDSAIKFIEEHYSKHKQSLAVSGVLRELYMANKEYSKARQLILSQIDEISGNSAPLYLALAKVEAVSQKNSLEAVKNVYLKGLKKNPDDPQLLMALAGLYQGMANNDAAREIYQKIIEKYPDATIAINNLASILTESDSSEDVAKGLQLASRFKEVENVYFQDTYAWSLIKNGKNSEGLEVLESLIVKEPKIAEFRYHLGVAHLNSGNKATAIMELKQAIALSEKSQRGFSGINNAKKLLEQLEHN